jgi:8-amino-7-oxononanoate synthase
VEAHGAGAAASRLVTGDHPLLAELEARLARLKGTRGACVFGSGYLANAGAIPTLVGPGDLVLLDELSHACQTAGAQLSGARVVRFPHNDVGFVAEALAARGGGRALVATDGVFSMDGDLSPVGALADACAAADAWLLIDDAHGTGVLGGGRGVVHAAGARVPLQMGTLSKALGGYGGFLCASDPVIDLIKSRARTFVYATGLPPAAAGAALAALDLIEADPALCEAPLRKARLFGEALGLPRPESPILPIVVGEAAAALAASARLAERGFLVAAIRPPTVPPGGARLRVTFSAAHDNDDIIRLAGAVRALELA